MVGLVVWVHFVNDSEFFMSTSPSRSPIQRMLPKHVGSTNMNGRTCSAACTFLFFSQGLSLLSVSIQSVAAEARLNPHGQTV